MLTEDYNFGTASQRSGPPGALRLGPGRRHRLPVEQLRRHRAARRISRAADDPQHAPRLRLRPVHQVGRRRRFADRQHHAQRHDGHGHAATTRPPRSRMAIKIDIEGAAQTQYDGNFVDRQRHREFHRRDDHLHLHGDRLAGLARYAHRRGVAHRRRPAAPISPCCKRPTSARFPAPRIRAQPTASPTSRRW